MNRELDAFYYLMNIYGLRADGWEKYQLVEKALKALKLIKGINFDIVYREQLDEWTLFIVIETQDGEHLEPVTFGSGKEEYDLLKEVLVK